MAPNAMAEIETDEADRARESARWLDLHDLVERCMGNLDLACRVLTRFRGSLDETLRQLDQMTQVEDWAKVAKRVHRLKGESGNVGCQPLAQMASDVEEACACGEAELVRSSLKTLARACRAFQREVSSPSNTALELTTGYCRN